MQCLALRNFLRLRPVKEIAVGGEETFTSSFEYLTISQPELWGSNKQALTTTLLLLETTFLIF